MKKKSSLYKGIALMLLSATLACIGQLVWKISTQNSSIVLLVLGLMFYGCGALLMVLGLRYGEMSILHPMMSAGYVLSLVLGALVLNENITILRVVGVAVIIAGLVFLSTSEVKKA